jgi:hypothetical protein
VSFDTFDTDSVVTAGITFTNGNLTAQGGAGVTLIFSNVAQAVEGKRSGKHYVEFTCVAVSGNVDGVGLVNSWGIMGSVGNAGFIGGTNTAAPSGDTGWGYYTNDHLVNLNALVTHVNGATWGAGDVIGVALDLDNGHAWWRKNTGSWIGTGGTPDPATNVGGCDISHMLANRCHVYPAVNLSGSAAKFTANFGASAFTGAVPSGFNSGWSNTTAGSYFGTFACSGRASANGVSAPPQNDKSVGKYVSNFTGPVDRIIFPFAGATISDMRAVIYDDTGAGGLPGALLGISNIITSGTYGEQTFFFSGVNLTSSSSYWFGLLSDAAVSSTQNVLLCPAQTTGVVFNSGPYPTPSNPFGASPSTNNFRYPVMIFPKVAVPGAFSDRMGPQGFLGIIPRTFRASETLQTTDPGAHPSVGSNTITDDRYGPGPRGFLGIVPRTFREASFLSDISSPGPASVFLRITQFSAETWVTSPSSLAAKSTQISAEAWIASQANALDWMTQISGEVWVDSGLNPPTSFVPAFLWVD